MSDSKRAADRIANEPDVIEFVPGELIIPSSGSPVPAKDAGVRVRKPAESVGTKTDILERSPAFRILAGPKLPELARENRARLSMQTPNRLFFYWSTEANPYQLLGKALKDQAGNYTLVLKLADLKRNTEEVRPIEPEGAHWFDVEADRRYRAEIGFYSPSRPYVRVMYSNVVETPRKSPSPHTADEAEWRVSSDRFAKVLDVAGFKQDAFDVAIAGDEPERSDAVSRKALSGLIGADTDAGDILADEIRYALLALAAGAQLESLRFRVGARLYALLQSNFAKLTAEKAMSAVRENFDVEAGEILEEETLSAVYGSSRVSFPRTLKRRFPQKFEPVGSHSLK